MINDISIIIPIYNTEKYLKQCLDSIVNQKISFHEIILVNDCSTDNSLKICKEYKSKYDNIKLINLDKNIGLGYARNEGLKIATGEYIYFCDSDDYLTNNFCDIVYPLLNNDIDLIRFKIKTIKECKTHWEETPNINNYKYFNKKLKSKDIFSFSDKNKYDIFKNCGVYHFIFKNKIIKKNDITFIKETMCEDITFVFNYLQFFDTFLYSDKIVYIRRLRKNSLTTEKMTKKQIDDAYNSIPQLINIYIKNNKRTPIDLYYDQVENIIFIMLAIVKASNIKNKERFKNIILTSLIIDFNKYLKKDIFNIFKWYLDN